MQEQNGTENLRVFIAVDPDAHSQPQLRDVQRHLKLKHSSNCIKWIKEDNFHLTIRFLGKTSITLLDDLCQLLRSVTERTTAFSLILKKIMVFPTSHPKVIAVGAQLTAELANLVHEIEQKIQLLGFEPEHRPFLPHITLGRISGPSQFDVAQTEELFLPLLFYVDEVILYQSELNSAGSIYTPIQRFALAKNNYSAQD